MAETTTASHCKVREGMKDRSYPWRNSATGKGTRRNSKTIAAWIVAAKKNAAIKPQTHCLEERLFLRNAVVRAGPVERGGPAPLAHHRKSPRKIASANAASGTPSLKSNSGHTLMATSARRSPGMTARNGIGNSARGRANGELF